ncbi:MAG: hypothetical protein IJU82_04820 [Ruminiclostridium sp.]|nr:hypothetical protein [Ruminiclostridium sp.]
MLIHSIVSLSDIFCNTGEKAPEITYKQIQGGMLELDGTRVRRLISTDPRLYLDKRFVPFSEYKDK